MVEGIYLVFHYYDGILHLEEENVEQYDKHSPWVEWMMVERKRWESPLKIYDIGQQEAKLCWLLLREFGHHMTYPFSKGVWVEETW